MRDIQNAMDDYTKAYDDLSNTVTQYANFADEKKSSVTLFVCVSGAIVSMTIAAYVPIRLLALLAGWIIIFSGHPSFKDIVRDLRAMSRKSQERLIAEITKKVDDEYISPVVGPELRVVVVYEYRTADGDPFYSGFSTIGNAGIEDEYVTSDIEAVQAPIGGFGVPETNHHET
ncbi:Putative uncharacterized protein [Taphrina deformans PYCC 5710]|uniref:TECPR1-like DysF domain-containing protein n=1 Tax=Taphrina deformans (strain PYCC 5710 / ATCC 11124 / CBS 356.35 / IMI 108563 / JCM 9778 / NBRC 8474) TaxID=1097556 RepID=R4XBN7_TAPDE|nr:Putative uncharacterized protein [Taphrina deformans PYCC 5710]|eukprot:CCG82995.1 Putative uncharacterized protein [Taphrina deformans PYCC 5710]